MLIDVVTRQPELTAEYVPYAKHRLRELRKQWQGYVLSQVTTVDRVRIQLEVLDESRGRVTLNAVMADMETAFLDVHGFGGKSAADFSPSLTYLNARIKSLSGHSLPNAYSHKVIDGGRAWGFSGCPPVTYVGTADIVDPPIGGQLTLKSDPPEFCSADLLDRKRLMRTIKPSNFTGLMKLYVQALYGSDRRTGIRLDYSRTVAGELAVLGPDKDKDGNSYYIKMGYGIPTTGLLKVGADRYLMVEIYEDTVRWRHMISDHEIELFSSKHPREAEAYRLSRLSPSIYYHTADGSGIARALQGRSVLAYGWHFARDKLEASLVSFIPSHVHANQMYVAGSGGETGAYHFQLFTLTFLYDAENDQLSYQLVPGGDGDFMPAVWVQVWFPWVGTNIMVALEPPTGPPGAYNAASTSAIIYCYYDENDTLATVRAQTADWKSVPQPPTTPWAPYNGFLDGAYFGVNQVIPGLASPVFHAFTGPVFRSGPWGVTVSDSLGGGEYLLTDQVSPNQEQYYWVVQGSANSTPQDFSYSDVYGHTVHAYSWLIQGDGRRDILTASGAYTHIGIFCVIPFDDASAVIVGTRKWKGAANVQYSVGAGGSVNQPYKITYSPNLPNSWKPYTDNCPYHDDAGQSVFGGYYFADQAVPTSYNQAHPLPFEFATEDLANSAVVKSFLHCASGSKQLYEWTWSYPADFGQKAPAYMPYDTLFTPSWYLPYYLHTMRVTTSFFGEYRVDYCLPPEVGANTVYSDDWPNVGDTAHNWGADIAVGWA